jgi:hypothetical protein
MNIANTLTLFPNLGVRSTTSTINRTRDGGKEDQEADKKDDDKKQHEPPLDKRANRDKAITATSLTIRALGTLGRNFATNGLWGGAAKASADFRAAGDVEEGGGASLSSDARSIAQPGFGRTTSKSSGITATSAQQVIYNETGDGWKEPPQQRDKQQDDKDQNGKDQQHDKEHQHDKQDHDASPSPTPSSSPKPSSSRARRYKVLVAATTDYSAAGDYRTTYASGLGFGRGDYSSRGQRDYDYGQPRPIPEAARSTTRGSTAVFDHGKEGEEGGGGGGDGQGAGGPETRTSSGSSSNSGNNSTENPSSPEHMRGEAKSRTTAVTTAPAASSRAAATTTVALGTTAARPLHPNDTFGGRAVILPITPERTASSDTSSLAIGRSYRHQLLPGLSVTSAGGDAGLGPSGGLAGSSADVFGFATGTRSSKARSEIVAAAPAANIGEGVIGRKKRRRSQKRRRTTLR